MLIQKKHVHVKHSFALVSRSERHTPQATGRETKHEETGMDRWKPVSTCRRWAPGLRELNWATRYASQTASVFLILSSLCYFCLLDWALKSGKTELLLMFFSANDSRRLNDRCYQKLHIITKTTKVFKCKKKKPEEVHKTPRWMMWQTLQNVCIKYNLQAFLFFFFFLVSSQTASENLLS